MSGWFRRARLRGLIDRTPSQTQRRPDEKRARLVAAARTAFANSGYGASVHEICQAAGVGIGTFYHQFPDKSDLMRLLLDEEHQYRVRAFDGLKEEDDLAAVIAGVIAGSDPALLPAMIEACGVDDRLRDFVRDGRKETRERLAAALTRVRRAREIRQPALDASTAAFAILVMGDAAIDHAGADELRRVIELLAFAATDNAGRARP